MCVSCGCAEPANDYGVPANITDADLVAAAEAVSKATSKTVTVKDVALNIAAWAKTQ